MQQTERETGEGIKLNCNMGGIQTKVIFAQAHLPTNKGSFANKCIGCSEKEKYDDTTKLKHHFGDSLLEK